jgi:CRISPR-associated endoribonuclease Cas6/Csy4 subtype I-F
MHHLIIRIRPQLDETGAGLATQPTMDTLLTRIHRAAHGAEYAVSFPRMRIGREKSLGDTVVLFANTTETLTYITSDRQVARVLRDSCECLPIRTVDEKDVHGWARFFRDRSVGRNSPSAIRRAQRRLEGGVRHQPLEPIVRKPVSLPAYRHSSLSMAKKGLENHEIPIFVGREDAQGPGSGGFDTFGLSRGGAVPLLDPALFAADA